MDCTKADDHPHCLICCRRRAINNIIENGSKNKKGANDNGESVLLWKEFPTLSEQDDPCLREELWAVFVLRKLLELPREEVADLLRSTFGVNPSSWIGLCLECSGLVKVAVQLNYQIMKLERDLGKVKAEIQRKLVKSVELEEVQGQEGGEGSGGGGGKKEGVLYIHQIIRGKILSKNGPKGCPRRSSPSRGEDDDEKVFVKAEVKEEVMDTFEDSPDDSPDDSPLGSSGDFNSDFKTEDHDGGDGGSAEDPLFRITEEPDLTGCNEVIAGGSNKNSKKRKRVSKKRDKVKLGKFVCSICKLRCSGPRHYELHMENHKLHPSTACHICLHPNASEVKLQIHLAKKHGIGTLKSKSVQEILTPSSESGGGSSKSKLYKCGHCSYTSSFRSAIIKHQETHKMLDNISALEGTGTGTTTTTDKFRCKLCEFEGGTVAIRQHFVDNHASQVGMSTVTCHLCNKVMVNVKALRFHCRRVHGEARFRCSICGKGFTRGDEHQEHFDKCSNGGQNPTICDLCGTSFSRKRLLEGHMKRFHHNPRDNKNNGRDRDGHHQSGGGKMSTKCSHCGMQLIHYKALQLHLRTSHPELYKFKCDECDAVFMHHKSIRGHKKATHLKQLVNCAHCSKQVATSFLKAHWAKHCKKIPPVIGAGGDASTPTADTG